jgi:integrase
MRKAQATFAFDEPFKCHDLRRTFASGLASLGVDRVVIGKLLNHVTFDRLTVTGSVYDRYDYVQEKVDALQRWEQHLWAILQGNAGVIPHGRPA